MMDGHYPGFILNEMGEDGRTNNINKKIGADNESLNLKRYQIIVYWIRSRSPVIFLRQKQKISTLPKVEMR